MQTRNQRKIFLKIIKDEKADFYDNIVRCDADHDGPELF